MKNCLITGLLGVFNMFNLFSQNIVFKDPEFKKTLVSFNVVDYDLDGKVDGDADSNDDKEISIQEAEAVLSLTISFININQIPEITYFKNLKHLTVTSSKIKDYLDLSKFPSMENLNYPMNKDTLFEIQNHPTIRRCTLFVRSPLKKIFINGNNHLTYLWFRTNIGSTMEAIDSLDVSNNALDTLISTYIPQRIGEGYFNCSNNYLTNANTIPMVGYHTSILSNNAFNTPSIYFDGTTLDLSNNQFNNLTLFVSNDFKNVNLLENPLTNLVFDASKIMSGKPPLAAIFPDLSGFELLTDLKVLIPPQGKFNRVDLNHINALTNLDFIANADTTILLRNLPSLTFLKINSKTAISIENINPNALKLKGPTIDINIQNKLTLINSLDGRLNFNYIQCYALEIINNPLLIGIELNQYYTDGFDLRVENNLNLKNIHNKNSSFYIIRNFLIKNSPALDSIEIGSFVLESFVYENIPNISYFKLRGSHPLFIFDGYEHLKEVFLKPTGVHLLNLPSLKIITFDESTITDFKLSNLPNLEQFKHLGNFSSSTLPNFHCDFKFEGFPKLKSIIIELAGGTSQFSINHLILNSLPALDTFFADNSYYKNVDINGLPNLKYLTILCNANNVNIQNCSQLKKLTAVIYGISGQSNSIRINDNPMLENLVFNTRRFLEATISNNSSLKSIKFSNYECRKLKLINLPQLSRITENYEPHSQVPTKITFSKLPLLRYFQSINRYFDTLDFSECPMIDSIHFQDWPANHEVSFLNMKNGNPNLSFFNWSYNFPNSKEKFIQVCSDNLEEENKLKQFIKNSAKSIFTQDCESNYILAYYDGRITSQYLNTNHAISNTTYFPVNINDDQKLTRVFTDGGGIYRYRTESKDKLITIEPDTINPNYEYNGPPIIFDPNQYGVFVNQDFALTIKNPIADIEAFIHSQQAAMPGTEYKLKLEIKNTTPFDAACTFQLSFDQEYMKINNSGGLQNDNPGILSGESGNISPYSSLQVPISFILNKPTDTPPLNINDLLTFHLVATPLQDDLTIENNAFSTTVKVVNSFDPNNVICAQGDEVTSNEEIKKIFYTVNFENLGNASAKNIRIENPIDTNWLDVNSFEVMNYSHPAQVSVTGDLATYYFENIDLPATGNNKGYITYAIRPKNELEIGDTIPNQADIYFDFNLPIATNKHKLTLIEPSSTEDRDHEQIWLFPNPSNGGFHIASEPGSVNRIVIYDLFGSSILAINDPDPFVTTDLPNGSYLIHVELETGAVVKRKWVVIR